MKNLITAVTLLLATSVAQASWNVPIFGDNSKGYGNQYAEYDNDAYGRGKGSAQGEGEFGFSMTFKGRANADGNTKAAADSALSGNGSNVYNTYDK